MELALYQPEIPQNTGTLLRLGACLGVKVNIIEPCGFVFSDRRMKRSGMDYINAVDYQTHTNWEAFLNYIKQVKKRIILLTPHTNCPYMEYQFNCDDILLLGQESCGVPESVSSAVDGAVLIPMQAGQRSLNIAISAAMVLGEALRQTQGFPINS